MKKRLDVLLVERGLAETRSQAQALVIAGLVPGYDKPGTQLDESVALEVERPPRFVSRGGEKLAHALELTALDPAGKDCLDVGASTGGFTDCLLQAGAARGIAVDVGYGQLHPRLRSDDRVHRPRARQPRRKRDEPPVPPRSSLATFVHLASRWRCCCCPAAPDWQALVLVKLQFEAGRADTPKGVVRDLEGALARAVRRRAAAAGWGSRGAGVVDFGLLDQGKGSSFFD